MQTQGVPPPYGHRFYQDAARRRVERKKASRAELSNSWHRLLCLGRTIKHEGGRRQSSRKRYRLENTEKVEGVRGWRRGVEDRGGPLDVCWISLSGRTFRIIPLLSEPARNQPRSRTSSLFRSASSGRGWSPKGSCIH